MKRYSSASLSLTITVAMVCAVPAVVFGNILAQDDFESYALGALSGQTGGGSGWAGDWTTPAGSATVVGGTSLAAQSVVTTVNSGQVTQSRQLASFLSGSDVYVSFLLQYSGTSLFDGNDTFSFHLSSAASSTAGLNFGARSVNGAPTFMVRSGTGGPVAGGSVSLTPPAFPVGQTFLAVAELKWDGVGSAYNTINAWLNPAYGDSGTPPVTQTLASGGVAAIGYAFFRNFDSNNGGTDLTANDFWTVDNLVIGTTWADVVPVPEPTSMALLGLGTFALVVTRRRKS
jgi:hypothetical protein